MKTFLVTLSLVVALGTSSVRAESAAAPGALLGAIAGGLIGGHNHDRWAEGAVIGGVAGAIIGAAVSPQERTVYQTTAVYQAPAYATPAPVVVYSQPAPQVVYVPASTPVYAAPAPTVVYVQRTPAYCPPPAVVYIAPRYGHHYRRW